MNTKCLKYFYAIMAIFTLTNSLCAMGTAMARQNEAVSLTPQEAIAGLESARIVATIMDKDQYRDPFRYSIHDNMFINIIRNLPEFHGPSSDQKRLAEEFDQKMVRQNGTPEDDEIYTYQQRQTAIGFIAASIVISHKISSTGRTVSSIARTTQDLALEQAKHKVYARLDQLKTASAREQHENELRQRAAAHAAAAAQAQTAHTTMQRLQDLFTTSNQAGLSNRGSYSARGSDHDSSSHNSGGDHSCAGKTSKGVSQYSGGSVCVASGCSRGNHTGKGGCDRSGFSGGGSEIGFR